MTPIRSFEGAFKGLARWCIDTEPESLRTEASVVDLRGWFAFPASVREIAGPFLADGSGERPLARVERTDVAAELGGDTVVGFDEVVDLASLARARGVLRVRADGESFLFPLDVGEAVVERGRRFEAAKAAKLERVFTVLACPRCRGPIARSADAALACQRCDFEGRVWEHGFELLGGDEEPAPLVPPFSAHRYDQDLRDKIAATAEGLVLDSGAGLRYETFDNVVNLDIAGFPSTDVIGAGEHLPFKDASFDGVISVAVLEHVRDPKACVEEIARIVRPGGFVYAAVPFLQPYHGYPHHYFNMTRDALGLLFAPYFRVDDITNPIAGHPISTLTWFLEWYAAGLPEEVRARFEAMPIGAFTGSVAPHVDEAYVTELAAATVADLACVNVLHGTRRQ